MVMELDKKEEPKYIKLESMEHWGELIAKSKEEKTKIIIDFYADWCGPCRAISPLFGELSAKYSDHVFLKVNADEFGELLEKLKVSGLPTFLVVSDAKIVDKLVGANPDKLVSMVETHCKSVKADDLDGE